MSEGKTTRLNKVLRELNISLDRAVEYLADKGHEIESRPTTKISGEVYQVLLDGFQTDASKKAASKEVGEEKRKEKEAIRAELEAKQERKRAEERNFFKPHSQPRNHQTRQRHDNNETLFFFFFHIVHSLSPKLKSSFALDVDFRSPRQLQVADHSPFGDDDVRRVFVFPALAQLDPSLSFGRDASQTRL